MFETSQRAENDAYIKELAYNCLGLIGNPNSFIFRIKQWRT